MAVSRSPELLLAEAQAVRSREAVRETQSLNRPQVSAGSGAAYNNGYPLSMEGAAPAIVNVTATQSLFSKKNSNLIQEAKELGKASRFGADSAREELISKTALVYYQLHAARQLIELASARLDETRQHQAQVEALVAAGRVKKVDKTTAQMATRNAQQQLEEAQDQAHLAAFELRELTGLPEAVTIKTLEPQIENPIFTLPPETLFQQALERAPEILQSETNLRAKELHVEAERGERLPQIEFVGEYAVFSKTNNYADYFNTFQRNNYLFGLSIRVPVFDGFRAGSRVAESHQEVTEARYRRDALRSNLRMTIERCSSALHSATRASDYARQDADQAQETVHVNEALLEGGRISPQEMEESRSLLQQREMKILEKSQVVFQRKLELLRAVGSIASVLE
jgi:outer membrane protein TolC